MNGHQYEYKCAKRLKRKGFSSVKVTKGSGDQGIDVIAYAKGKKYGIQCKYYSNPVGNRAVQEAYAGARYYDCNIAVVMTNSTFTHSARELARKTNVLLWESNQIPRAANGFWLTKWIGLFFCFVGILGLILMQKTSSANLPPSRAAQLILLTAGGLFAVLEHRKWILSLLSGFFYLFSALISLSACILAKKMPGYTFWLFMGVIVISFIRADYLHIKTSSSQKSFRKNPGR